MTISFTRVSGAADDVTRPGVENFHEELELVADLDARDLGRLKVETAATVPPVRNLVLLIVRRRHRVEANLRSVVFVEDVLENTPVQLECSHIGRRHVFGQRQDGELLVLVEAIAKTSLVEVPRCCAAR